MYPAKHRAQDALTGDARRQETRRQLLFLPHIPQEFIYFFFKYFWVSMATAIRIMAPFTTNCIYGFTPT